MPMPITTTTTPGITAAASLTCKLLAPLGVAASSSSSAVPRGPLGVDGERRPLRRAVEVRFFPPLRRVADRLGAAAPRSAESNSGTAELSGVASSASGRESSVLVSSAS